ncbi:MAG: metal-dependent hydrolase [Flavobacteriales bacterium]|nr:metal-dependent hydrolase [Flavobacteriales bacterium]MCB9447670.1 metal-dependent hydrolase [Flavobacteriales bacterium]
MKITYYGHACFSLETGDTRILVDPFISPNPLAKAIDVTTIQADYILISHGHEDHVADALAIAKRTGAMLISNYEIVNWFAAQGIKHTHPMNLGGSKTFPFGRVKYVNAVHSSGLPDGTYGGNPGGFVIETDEGTVYYSGDTALTMDMQLISRNHKVNLALLPIGDNFTMGVDDALVCAEMVGCRKILGLHYDTFPYIVINHEEARGKAKAKQIELLLPAIGESVNVTN